MITEAQDLKDFLSLQVEQLEQALTQVAKLYGETNKATDGAENRIVDPAGAAGLRLIWQGQSAESVQGFSFRPVYSYEREAVADSADYSCSDKALGWHTYSGAESLAPEALAALLEATLWQGRPVLKGRADYWMTLDLGERQKDYERLLDATRANAPSTELEPLSDVAKHNLIPPVWQLLSGEKTTHPSQRLNFGWAVDSARLFMGEDDLNKQTLAGISELEIRLHFMPQSVVLIQWRLNSLAPKGSASLCAELNEAENDMAKQQRLAGQALRGLLQSGLDGRYLTIDTWLRIHQSMRWELQSFKEQVAEGKLVHAIEFTLPQALLQVLDFEWTQGGSCGEALLELAANQAHDDHQPPIMYDARRYCSWSVAPLSTRPGQRFNGALQRAWVHLLGTDTPFPSANEACDNYPFDAAFCTNWIDQRTYKRWADTGLLYGFSEHSAAVMGTSSFFRDQVFERDIPGLYSELTRFCLYQQTRLRSLAMAFSQTLEDRGRRAQGRRQEHEHFKNMQKQMATMRDELQRFNRIAWFHRASTQLQPEELYQAQLAAMNLEQLHRNVRDEFADVSDWLASVESIRQRRRDWTLALIGLAIAVPGVLQIWGAGQSLVQAQEPSRGVFGAIGALLASGDFWLLIALFIFIDQISGHGRLRKRVLSWIRSRLG